MAYQQKIEQLSHWTSGSHAYPGAHLIGLQTYLSGAINHQALSERSRTPTPAPEDDETASFVVLFDIKNGKARSSGTSLAHFEDFAAQHEPKKEPFILFLRGYGPPEWLITVGETFNISYGLYQRHLQHRAFASVRNLFTQPALPSDCTRIFQFTIPCICNRDPSSLGFEPEDLQPDRRQGDDLLNKYFNRLRAQSRVGDSVVRNYIPLSKQYFVLEQTITVAVDSEPEGWKAVVWLDSGRDLSESIPGPWSPSPQAPAWETYFLPIIVQRHDYDRVKGPKDKQETMPGHAGSDAGAGMRSWRAAQNISLLPFQFGSNMNSELARQDALYALQEIFRFAASAESQLLNVLHQRIEQEVSFMGGQDVGEHQSTSFLNLKHIKTYLASHAEYLEHTLYLLQARDSLDWPKATDCPEVDREVSLLVTDFSYLISKAQALQRDCEQGMTILANNSALEEARRSSELGMRVQRLTVIATAFIPLSFLCSVWGMNFVELGSGNQPMKLLPLSALPIIAIALLLYYWAHVWTFVHRIWASLERSWQSHQWHKYR